MRILIILSFLLLVGCQNVQKKKISQEKIQHIVLIWLKDSSPENRFRVMKASKELYKIKELKAMTMGPTVQSDRDIVDDSFDIAYVMDFDSVEDMQTYLDHPVHVELVKTILKPSMEKVLVYDIRAH